MRNMSALFCGAKYMQAKIRKNFGFMSAFNFYKYQKRQCMDIGF